MERIGVGFSGGFQPKEIVECVTYAEELGYDSAWVAEGHSGDQFTILTACALATSRIKLGTSISSVFVRSAPTIAMAAACVDDFSNGRFILGLGSSHSVQVIGEHGLEYSKPLSRIRESVDIIRTIWRDGEIRSYHGTIFNIEWFNLWFRPLRQDIPIYLGAVNPRMLETTGEIAQGVILTRATPEQTRTALAHVAEGARKAGREPAEVDMATQLACSVSENKDAARDRLRDRIAMYAARFPRYRKVMAGAGYAEEIEAVKEVWLAGDQPRAKQLVPVGLIDGMGLVGTPAEVRARLQAYREVGITLPIVAPNVDRDHPVEETKALLQACAPR
jgi:alkanesulfonate monooxygenase SsuD/methylene tetrahydromethanopterin reductase-like flavin-dependent oxidoreductase (luciferase family)